MFIHQLVGCLIFLFFGPIFDHEINVDFLIAGAISGSLPDLFYLIEFVFKKTTTGKSGLDKNSHTHRQGFSHTIYYPFALAVMSFYLIPDFTNLVFMAALTHPFLDLWGIGWGVKLFGGKITYKMFYKGRYIVRFTDEQLAKEVEEYGMDDWFKRVYITFDPIGVPWWYGIMDWACLFTTVGIIGYYW